MYEDTNQKGEGMLVKTTCNRCGASFHIDLGTMTRAEAEAMFRKLDATSRQCPGGHVEFGGFYAMWNLEDALHRTYDLGETVELNVPSDEEHVRTLLEEGRDIWDGGANKVPRLDLPSIHGLPGLKHLGFGEFANDTHIFKRCDSPRGTRFYERIPRVASTAGKGVAR
jgi:hypothetical protein